MLVFKCGVCFWNCGVWWFEVCVWVENYEFNEFLRLECDWKRLKCYGLGLEYEFWIVVIDYLSFECCDKILECDCLSIMYEFEMVKCEV